MERHSSALALITSARPDLPVQCLRPHAAEKAAHWFRQNFPGEVLYAVKANTHPLILDSIYHAGVNSFDVASVPEIELISKRFPKAKIALLHPVKARSTIGRAYFNYGIRIFAVDSIDELAKIMDETKNARDLQIIVRIAVPSDYAHHKLAGKFGTTGSSAISLLQQTRSIASRLGVSFHVGSQCLQPKAWRIAMKLVNDLIHQAGVSIDIVDVGGGFPSAYPGFHIEPLSVYLHEISTAFDEMPTLGNAELWCEPGRALCAEAGSHILRVELRKGDTLYLNDGAFGALYDAAHEGLVFPVQLLRSTDRASTLKPFKFFGPTCDAFDAIEGPYLLPDDINEGDYIEFGNTGAYGTALATTFNGFGTYQDVQLDDAPINSMYKNKP